MPQLAEAVADIVRAEREYNDAYKARKRAEAAEDFAWHRLCDAQEAGRRAMVEPAIEPDDQWYEKHDGWVR